MSPRVNARRTERVRTLHRCIGLAVGGEAGARLVQRLAIPVSADTLLRAACEVAREAKPRPTPRVLGVDDWAWRKGASLRKPSWWTSNANEVVETAARQEG